MSSALPPWAEEMRDAFKSGAVSQFILHGNIFDYVPAETAGAKKLFSLNTFLDEVMFAGYDVVLHYDRGRGVRATKGAQDWGDYLDLYPPTEFPNIAFVRDPGRVLELIDRYLLRTLNLQALMTKEPAPRKIAVILDFAEFVVPNGDPLQLGGEFSANVVKLLGWANDPAILNSNIVTVLMTEGLHDLNDLVVENPHTAKLKIPLPNEREMLEYLQAAATSRFPDLAARCETSIETLARRLTGLSRAGAQRILSQGLQGGRTITTAFLTGTKKDMIER